MKTVVIGLDCADPVLLFEKYRSDLPMLSKLMSCGSYARLNSIDPPITVPAWMCMMTGKSPGQLGIYGFRNLTSRDPLCWQIIDSSWVKEPAIWETTSEAGLSNIIIGVPLSYPVKPLNGIQIGCFLTPNKNKTWVYPHEMQSKIIEICPSYTFDVSEFRSEDYDRILEEIYATTAQRIHLSGELIQSIQWDLFVMVEIATDRLHHVFWKFMDESHNQHTYHPIYSDAIRKYYIWLDHQLKKWFDQLSEDSMIYIVSDHGAKKMEGGFRLNQWLLENGYLTLHQQPQQEDRLSFQNVDWSRTVAWGEGGYYGRLFLNVRGREPAGIVDPTQIDTLLDEIETQLIRTGSPLTCEGFTCHRPQHLYGDMMSGIPPDLMIYAGNLSYRCLGTFGRDMFTVGNDSGPDGANHSKEGIIITARKKGDDWLPNDLLAPGDIGQYELLDVHSLLLETLKMKYSQYE